jgi:hypothetical protein
VCGCEEGLGFLSLSLKHQQPGKPAVFAPFSWKVTLVPFFQPALMSTSRISLAGCARQRGRGWRRWDEGGEMRGAGCEHRQGRKT